MIQAFVERLEDGLDLGEVANPAGLGVHFTLDIDRHPEGMTMQAPALVAGGDMRQAMGSLEDEFFEQFHGVSR